jgi:hypothetical protein
MYAWNGLLLSIRELYGVDATMAVSTSASAIHNLKPSAGHLAVVICQAAGTVSDAQPWTVR